jgi:hypothetical protein
MRPCADTLPLEALPNRCRHTNLKCFPPQECVVGYRPIRCSQECVQQGAHSCLSDFAFQREQKQRAVLVAVGVTAQSVPVGSIQRRQLWPASTF